ncbi:MAG: HepT-like ribonuclease domain-containing protein [Acidimicrobiales bacterium]
MLEAADQLEELVGRGRDVYEGDVALRLAIERLLAIIGEAANAMSDDGRGRFPTVEWRDITRLRIVLAHHYHRVDPDQVWTIASEDVPRLARRLQPPA